MCDVDSKLMIYHENLKRLRRHLEVVRQIQMAPQMYVCAVGEVVRRRTFSQAFLVWAGELASQLQAVHSDELVRRRDFQSRFEGHFLNMLFPGMEDSPPPFATQAPLPFDTMLAKVIILIWSILFFPYDLQKLLYSLKNVNAHACLQLNKDDVDRLKTEVPNLATSLTVPEISQLADLFTRSISKTLKTVEKNSTAIEEHLVRVRTVLINCNIND